MATNKNQHYAPRCHFKPFTKDEAGLSINLFNLDRRSLIRNAPVKYQCSGDYFYGQDAELEQLIQSLEGSYSTVRKAIHEPGYRLVDDDRKALKDFWLFQHLRTDAASRQIAEMANGAADFFMDGDPRFRMEIKAAVQQAMRMYPTFFDSIVDLKVCLMRNRSAVPFITSDDPAVLANRLHQQHRDLRNSHFSLVSAGALLMLPLSPTVLCLGYDGDVYGIAHENGWVTVKHDEDVRALNEHQLLNARANVFLSAEVPPGFDEDVARMIGRRIDTKHVVTFMVPVERTECGERFRTVSREEAEQHEDALVRWSQHHPEPASWPQQIRLRAGAIAYSNGNAVGWVREAQLRPSARPYVKIRIA